jgi:hypothetical protein
MHISARIRSFTAATRVFDEWKDLASRIDDRRAKSLSCGNGRLIAMRALG